MDFLVFEGFNISQNKSFCLFNITNIFFAPTENLFSCK